jgi:STE24 endopeptidase
MRAAVLAVLAAIWGAAAVLLWRSSRVPDDLRLPAVDIHRLFSAADLARAERYDRFVRIDALLSELALVVVLAFYAVRGARLRRQSAAGPIGTGMLLGMLGLALVWMAQAPFGLAELWWERRHDISHESYGLWILESWFGLGGEFLYICFALLIVMGLARLLGDRWWIPGAAVFVALAVLLVFVQPYLLPDVHDLNDPTLAASAANLAHDEGVEGTPVKVQDVHELTSAPNAEATGLGPSRRVILWDTLLDGRFPPDEVRFVLAHEFGHLARDHLPKLLAWYTLFAIPGAFLIARATRRRGGMGEPAAVPLSLFVLVVLNLAALPVWNAISRHAEAEADWMALQTTRDPSAGRSLFRRFTTTVLEPPSPPTWDYLLFSSHPTIEQRIAMVDAWRARTESSAGSGQPAGSTSP